MQKKRLLSASREPYMQLPIRRPMTLPDERYRSVKFAEQFLTRLAGGHYARTPRAVRDEARSILRHYPSNYDMLRAASAAPEVFQEQMEDLHRFVATGVRATAENEAAELNSLQGYKNK